jgi:hypothetical protein
VPYLDCHEDLDSLEAVTLFKVLSLLVIEEIDLIDFAQQQSIVTYGYRVTNLLCLFGETDTCVLVAPLRHRVCEPDRLVMG